jgi:hypothetical protein
VYLVVKNPAHIKMMRNKKDATFKKWCVGRRAYGVTPALSFTQPLGLVIIARCG